MKKLRVLILGASGMLGHKLYQLYGEQFETWGSVRGHYDAYAHLGIYDPRRLIGGVDVLQWPSVERAFEIAQPDWVINCVGIIKQLPTATDPILSLQINSLLPHHLANLCVQYGAKLIHISTDCVFNGGRGMYQETDPSDAEDLYGRTKFLGELPDHPAALTLRTSIIGRELKTTSGLVEWFLGNHPGGQVEGYTAAIYSGFTTIELARIIAAVMMDYPALTGVWQVSSEPIDKYTLLQLVRDAYELDVTIKPSARVKIDRSLDSGRFRAKTGIVMPTWPAMIEKMAQDPTPYDQWRRNS